MTIAKLYTAPQAARIIQVHPHTMRKLIRLGQVTVIQVASRKMVPESAISDYLSRNTREALA